jgi:hypothetical protein
LNKHHYEIETVIALIAEELPRFLARSGMESRKKLKKNYNKFKKLALKKC